MEYARCRSPWNTQGFRGVMESRTRKLYIFGRFWPFFHATRSWSRPRAGVLLWLCSAWSAGCYWAPVNLWRCRECQIAMLSFSGVLAVRVLASEL